MGIVFSSLWSKLFSKAEVKIVIVGLDNAGKTTILYKLLMNQVVTTTPTIGSNVEEDVGGQESLRASWKTYYVNTKAVIMVIDSTDTNRLHIAKQELHQMMENEQLRDASLLVFANKQDVKDALSAAKISEILSLTSLKDRQWHIQACSALSGDGLFEGLDWVVLQIAGS
ncbi:ADP-ribosylation factor-like protein 5A [Apophysomyces ossiformis]|uniref:ADP-ribosylation factor-like protein 5A n=1 Tax=Apophysomyces ossiformis TaxID=679940 RepID=A0A8H7BMN9_9FUNG|nr:ADP-ribosylation factor-like protein 5A [Apophysomyces ossiformis]